MDFCVKILFGFLVFIGANLWCSAKTVDNPLAKSCYIQYLQEKGKLDEPLPSTVQPPSRCRLVVPYISNIFADRVVAMFTAKVADCIKNVNANTELYDLMLKQHLYRSLFGDEEAHTRLAEANYQFQSSNREVISKCKTNERNAIRNETLEDYQFIYCMRKYATDSLLIEINEKVNPGNIDTESVNCTNVIAIDRSNTETLFKDKVAASDCAMNEFRSGDLFDWKVVMTVFRDFDKIFDTNDKQIEEFLSMTPSQCEL